MTDREIHDYLGGAAGLSTIRKARIRMGLPLNRAPRKGSEKSIDREYLAREFDETMKASQLHGDHTSVRRQIRRVAGELGVNYDYLVKVYSHEMKLVEPQSPRKYTDEQLSEAKRLLKEHGLSYMEVSRKTDIPWDRLRDVFPGYGLSASESATVRWVNMRMRELGI